MSSAIAMSADGQYMFLAVEDDSGDNLIVRAHRDDLQKWEPVYETGAGSASNVAQVPGNPDQMIFHGNYGTDVVIVRHTISTGANDDISPASLGTKVVNTLEVNPSDSDEIIASIDTDQDLERTEDGGTTWAELDAALGFNATALGVFWSNAYALERYFVAGNDGANLDLLYSPNEGDSDTDKAGATVGAADNIVSVIASERL